jgi:hypothetical protein
MNGTGSKSIWRRVKTRIRRSIKQRQQAAVRWAAVGCYAVLALGIPLPMPATKTAREPYPCMNHRCGCQSAEECWRHCCCTTLEERLIWARENHVRPPEYALAEARDKGITWAVNWPSDESWHKAVERAATEDSAAQGETHTCACGRCGHGSNVQPHNDTADGVILIEALKCRGAGENWQGLAISLPPPQAVSAQSLTPSIERVTIRSLHFTTLSFPPATPPPRLHAAVLS